MTVAKDIISLTATGIDAEIDDLGPDESVIDLIEERFKLTIRDILRNTCSMGIACSCSDANYQYISMSCTKTMSEVVRGVLAP